MQKYSTTYQPKLWKPTEQQERQLEELCVTPGFVAMCEKAEKEHSEGGKWLLSLTETLDMGNEDDRATLEKEGIRIRAVTEFLEEIKRYSSKYIGDAIPE